MTGAPEARRAVVDRIVENLAVLLVGPDEQEHHLPVEQLPDGVGEGAWLVVTGAGPGLRIVGLDPEGEADRRSRNEERLARLRRSRGRGRFDDGR